MAGIRSHHETKDPKPLGLGQENPGEQVGTVTHQQPPPSRALTQQQRLAWLRELIDGDSESLAYRVAGIPLLLFGQPLTKIAALPTSAITITENDVRISLGQEPIPVPQPFADMLSYHMASRPNLGATAGMAATPWLFP